MNIKTLFLPVAGVTALFFMLRFASYATDRRRLFTEALRELGFVHPLINHFDDEDWCVYGEVTRTDDKARVRFNANRQGDRKVHLQITCFPDFTRARSKHVLDLP